MTTPAHAPSDAEIHDLLRQWRAAMATVRPRWSATELTFTQLRALSTIARKRPLRVSALASHVGIGLAAASALADRMERQDLIARKSDPDDRRIVLLDLTPRGRHELETVERGSTAHFGRLIARMTPVEREALAATLRAFARLTAENASC